MTGTNYRYELRRGDEIVATGHLTWEHQLKISDEITIGRDRGVVRAILPLLSSRESRLVVEIADDDADSNRRAGR